MIRQTPTVETHSFLKSRTGAVFGATVSTEHDGALTILTNEGHGYLSAHRDYAREHFGHVALWRMTHLSWINASGARVVLTRWQPLSVWQEPAHNRERVTA